MRVVRNWSDKAKEIADGIIAKCGVKSSITLSDDNLRALLEDAALQGMQHELDAWLNRPRKNQQTSETT